MKNILWLTMLFVLCFPLSLLTAAEPAPGKAEQEIEKWWKEQTDNFRTSETSPLAASGSFYLNPGQRLALVPGQPGRATEPITHGIISVYAPPQGFVVTFTGITKAALQEKAVTSTSLTIAGNGEVIKADGLIIRYSLQGETGRVMAFQPGTPKQKSFKGFTRYPIDLRYRVPMQLVPLKVPEPVIMGTSQGRIKNFLRVGYFDFDIAGDKFKLYAYKESAASAELFLPFKDGSAGKETYGAGRYVDPELVTNNMFIIDFNVAYNPLCALSPYYNCVRPPTENCIMVQIKAGEKAPPAGSH